MNVEYFYCSYCGYEDFNIYVAYSATYANGPFCKCPECKHEVSGEETET
jgi:hypothetical protein